LIKKITEIEKKIIEYYKAFYCVNKKCSFSLSNLLQSGRIKLYKDDEPYFTHYQPQPPTQGQKKSKVVLKISGVWETETDVGLTYKFVEMYDYMSVTPIKTPEQEFVPPKTLTTTEKGDTSNAKIWSKFIPMKS